MGPGLSHGIGLADDIGGDAAGVGPEIIMKSLAHGSVYEACRPLVIGDTKRLVDAGRRAGVTLEVRSIKTPAEARFERGVVDCIDLGLRVSVPLREQETRRGAARER